MDTTDRAAQAEAFYRAGLKRVATTPPPAGQKYPIGTRVKIISGGWYKGKLATVEYTYAHAYGGHDVKSYSLKVDGRGTCSWFHENDIEPVTDTIITLAC